MPLPPPIRDPRKVDAEHVRLLAVFHYVAGGLAVAGLGFVALHWAIMRTVFTNPKLFKDGVGPPPAEFFAMFQWMYVIMGVLLVVGAVLNLASARCLQLRRHRTFSLVVAGLNCPFMPVGTLLAVFTFIVLLRESVADLYEPRQQPSCDAEPPLLPATPPTDLSHLRILVICHYIKGAVAVFNLVTLVFQFRLMESILLNPQFGPNGPPPELFAGLFRILLTVWTVFVVLSAVLNLVSARCLQLRVARGFSLVVAGFNLLSLPLGTALGVFTFMVLRRDPVKALYGREQPTT